MSDVAASPLRVGLFPSVGRSGLHLIERFAESGPFRVVAALDPVALGLFPLATTNLVAPFGVRLASTLEELTHAADIDVFWATSYLGFRNDSNALTGPYCGKHMIAEAPMTLSSAMAEKVFSQAADRNRLFLVYHPRRADPDFRQALSVAENQEIGPIRAAKFVSWSYGLPPRGAIRGNALLTSDGSDDPRITKIRFVTHALDQLVPLIGDQPVSVFATGDPNAPGAPDLMAGYSLVLQIAFGSGCQAEIDIRLDSPTQFQSGWLLTGQRGGYAKGRKYMLTDDGEVFDSPVAQSIGKEDVDQFEWLARQIRSGVADAAEEARVKMVVALLDAAQRSLDLQQAVRV